MSRNVVLHPDDDPSLLHKPESWSSWKFITLLKMRSLNLGTMIDGTRLHPEDPDALAAWDLDNHDAMFNIGERLHPNTVRHVTHCTTAAQMWTELLNHLESRTQANRTAVIRRFYQHKFETGVKVATYISRMKELAADCRNVGVEIDQTALVATIISGLPSDFNHAILTFENKSVADQTVHELSAILSRQEVLEDQFKSASTRPSTNQPNESVALAHGVQHNQDRYNSRPFNGQRSFRPRDDSGRFSGRCSYCGIRGHRSVECRRNPVNNQRQQRQLNNLSERPVHRFNENRPSESFDRRPSQLNNNRLSNNFVSGFNGNRQQDDYGNHRGAFYADIDGGQPVQDDPEEGDPHGRVIALSATVRTDRVCTSLVGKSHSSQTNRVGLLHVGQSSPRDSKSWCGDSGSGSHMTPNRFWFLSYETLEKNHTEVILGDEHVLPAIGIGTVPIIASDGKRFALTRTLHVPGLKRNLFSIGEVTKKGSGRMASFADGS